jgi:hypothetical protein
MRRLLTVSCLAAGVAICGAGTAHAASPPDAPTNVVATPGNERATVMWTAPASDGGSPITSYLVVASGGSSQTCLPATGELKCVVRRLANGTGYTFTVTAQNAAGSSPASAPSNPITPAAPPGPPGPPTNVAATAGDKEAIVDCGAPTTTGGAPITSYTATSTPGGKHATAAACPITVKGLTDGTSYTFTVTATNGSKGVPSAPSAPVIPMATQEPSPPARVVGHIDRGAVVISWTAPRNGAEIVRYEVYLNGKQLTTLTGTTATLHDFERHGDSVYTVTAFDSAGNESRPSAAVTVHPTPFPPGVPRPVPGWTSRLFTWQRHGETGVRPKTPRPLPAWYAAWKHWRLTPIEIVS